MDEMISRQAVLKLLSTMPPEEAMTKAMLIQSVKQMAAAQPERKRGEWEPWRCDMYKCSECGYIYTELSIDRCEANYCPHCGAKMEVNDGSD